MILVVKDLTVSFGDGARTPLVSAVDNVSFEVSAGETFAIIGESGSGKTQTALSLLGLQPSSALVSGSVQFRGMEISRLAEAQLRKLRGKDVGFVYQNPLNAFNPVWTVGEQISETMRALGVANRRQALGQTLELLDRVHIPDPRRVATSYPHQLSGGMLQRAVIAMALSCKPSLLIADEPTTALDVTIKAQILDLLSELKNELGLTILLITHDMGVVAELADKIMVMYCGRIVERGPADQVMLEPKHHYTRALLQTAMISESEWKSQLPAISGAAPSLLDRPAGCVFHPRCPAANSVCSEIDPQPISLEGRTISCHHPVADEVLL